MSSKLSTIYTKKQIKALKSLFIAFWVLVLHGAKRTGKTIINNDIFLQEIKRVKKIAKQEGVKKPQYILLGHDLGAIQRNVLNELSNKYNIDFKLDKHNRFELFGVVVCCFGHGSIRDMDRIRGMTAYGAYINEASLGREEVIREVFNRCSGTGARIIMDTNPDSPEHYIKKDYIDKADGKKIIEIHFELDDNTFLSETYKENIKLTTPSGLFYDRDIKGLWVNAEGTVYKDFNSKTMKIDNVKNIRFVKYIAGVDWGYEHRGAIVVIGIDQYNNHYLIEEHSEQYQEIDYWVKIALDIKKRYGNIPFYCDSARPEHVARFSREGLNAKNGNKSVLSGIEVVASLMKQNKFFVVSSCKEYIREVYNYVWHKTKDEPLKINDDVQDAVRYAIYTNDQEHKKWDKVEKTKWGNYL